MTSTAVSATKGGRPVSRAYRMGPRGYTSGAGTALELARQAAPSHELQGEVGPALPLAHLVDLHDVRVAQVGDGSRLGPEAGQLGTAGVAAGQDALEGDDTVEADLPGLVDDP